METLLTVGLPAKICAVISNDPQAGGLDIAARHGVATTVVNHRDYTQRADFDAALARAIDAAKPDLVVLAGFMRVLTADFVNRHHGRMINIHPSLLPSFTGLHTHRQALEAGVRVHGCTVHFVTPQLDHGPIIIQAAVPVLPGDDEHALAKRVLAEEHRIYPQAVRWLCEDRVTLTVDGQVHIRGVRPAAQVLLSPALDA